MAKPKDQKYTSLAQEKVAKKVGRHMVEQMDLLSEAELRQAVVQSSTKMKEVKDELDANPKYQQIKSDKANLEAGKKAVDDREKAIIGYALEIIQTVNKMLPEERYEYEMEREKRLVAKKKKEAKQ